MATSLLAASIITRIVVVVWLLSTTEDLILSNLLPSSFHDTYNMLVSEYPTTFLFCYLSDDFFAMKVDVMNTNHINRDSLHKVLSFLGITGKSDTNSCYLRLVLAEVSHL